MLNGCRLNGIASDQYKKVVLDKMNEDTLETNAGKKSGQVEWKEKTKKNSKIDGVVEGKVGNLKNKRKYKLVYVLLGTRMVWKTERKKEV